MNGQIEVERRMEKIREIFQYAMHISAEQEDLKLFGEQVENTENEFRSIAYEGVSMALALKDFSVSNTLNHWRLFMEGPGVKHAVHVHAGLGWAIAQQRISILPIIETLDPLMWFRVLDGYGYYDGIFRQRKTIGDHRIPPDFDNSFLQGYDQGVGRSLWYICKGDTSKIPGLVAGFSSSRHKDLWRGIGTACVYVGGSDENMLRELLTSAEGHHAQLSVGAALVSRTRRDTKTPTPDIELACRMWCNCSAEEAILVTVKTEPSKTIHPGDVCSSWLSHIKEELLLIQTN
jgi:enediyne biosynthesis protein E3